MTAVSRIIIAFYLAVSSSVICDDITDKLGMPPFMSDGNIYDLGNGGYQGMADNGEDDSEENPYYEDAEDEDEGPEAVQEIPNPSGKGGPRVFIKKNTQTERPQRQQQSGPARGQRVFIRTNFGGQGMPGASFHYTVNGNSYGNANDDYDEDATKAPENVIEIDPSKVKVRKPTDADNDAKSPRRKRQAPDGVHKINEMDPNNVTGKFSPSELIEIIKEMNEEKEKEEKSAANAAKYAYNAHNAYPPPVYYQPPNKQASVTLKVSNQLRDPRIKHFHLNAKSDIWKSADERTSVQGSAFYEKVFDPVDIGSVGDAHYGASVTLTHRWRRSVNNEDPIPDTKADVEVHDEFSNSKHENNDRFRSSADENIFGEASQHGNTEGFVRNRRFRRSPQMPPDSSPHVRVDAFRNLWASKDGRTSVNGNAHFDRSVTGPEGEGSNNYGAGLSVSHQQENTKRSNAAVQVNKIAGLPGTQVRADGSQDLWKSSDGQTNVQASGYIDGNVGAPYHHRRRDYGGALVLSRLFRQGLQRANVALRLNRGRGIQGTQVRLESNADLWRSNDGKTAIQGNVYFDKTLGAPDNDEAGRSIGGGLTFFHKF